MMSTIAVSVVDLPDPVGPVSSTSPRGSSARSRAIAGAPSSSSEYTRSGMKRSAMAIDPSWRNTLCGIARCRRWRARGRPRRARRTLPAGPAPSGRTRRARPTPRSEASAKPGIGTRSPSTRMSGGRPAVMWMSDARCRAPWARQFFEVVLSHRVTLPRRRMSARRPAPRSCPRRCARRGRRDAAEQARAGSQRVEEGGDLVHVCRRDADGEVDLLATADAGAAVVARASVARPLGGRSAVASAGGLGRRRRRIAESAVGSGARDERGGSRPPSLLGA